MKASCEDVEAHSTNTYGSLVIIVIYLLIHIILLFVHGIFEEMSNLEGNTIESSLPR